MDSSKYNPEPEDTSAIELDPNLRDKIEALARNNHDVWARARLNQGWKYGPEPNNDRKEHPGLVPYEQLTETEKDIDRGTVVQALKVAIKHGLDIHPTRNTKESECKEEHHLPVDDMDEWPHWPSGLSNATITELDKAVKAIGCTYQAANKSAAINLLLHRAVALIIAIAGTYAVLMAIFQLYDPKDSAEVTEHSELAFAIAAGIAVLIGLCFAFMRKWLVRRHRAERCRFLKFDFLLDVALAGQDPVRLESSAHTFENQAYNLGVLEYDQMELWLEEEQVLRDPPAAPQNESVMADVRLLAEHYLRTRLAVQSRYFYKQSGRNTRWNLQSQNLAPMLFVGSIGFALAHFVISKWWPHAGNTRLLVLLAAALPVLGAGIRAVRGIWEYSRNTLRFTAKYNALRELIADLETELRTQTSSHAIVRLLWKGEQILEGEHREWLRLMMETEWIG
jgi:hypothetical protein